MIPKQTLVSMASAAATHMAGHKVSMNHGAEQSQEKCDKRVMVIGGGPAGYASAITLASRGERCEIFEKRGQQSYHAVTGSVINVSSVAVGQLKKMDPTLELYKSFKEKANPIDTSPVVHLADGSRGCLPLHNVNVDRITGKLWADVKGFERAHVIRRQELMDLLYKRALELKVPVHFNKTFSHYEEHDTGVEAFFKDGTRFRGAALLGADGTHSPVRKQLLGSDRSTEAVPQYSWVFGSLDGDWRADLGLDREHHPGPNKIAIGCGAGPRAMWIFGIEHKDGQQGHLEWGAVHPCGLAEGAVVASASGADDAEQTATGGMTSRPGLFVSVEELVKAYGDGQFGEMARVLHTAGNAFGHGKLPAYATFFVPDAGFWSSGKHSNGGCGRVMLLGDAAHALPNVIALGATLALEDGYRVGIELAAVLKGASGPPDAEAIAEAFKLTEAKRRPRVDKIRNEAMKRQENLLSGTTYQWYMTLFAFNYILWFLNIVPPSARDEMEDSPAGEPVQESSGWCAVQ